MKRWLLCSAVIPLAVAGQAAAETSISTKVTTPVATSTAASGQPDSLVITADGGVAPTVAGAAVTVDSDHAVTNNGAISFSDVNGATGILLKGGFGSAVTNAGSIVLSETYTPSDSDSDGDLDGLFAQGFGRFGIRLGGPGAFSGTITNSGSITVSGVDSAGIQLETRLIGSLLSSGSIVVVGDRSLGVAAASVSGDVRITSGVSATGEGASAIRLGAVDGAVVLQGPISATGYRSSTRLTDAERAKLDADDLKQGGAAVAIMGSVGKGVLLDAPPGNLDADDADEDDDGVDDSAEATAAVSSFGAAPAIDVGGDQAITLGAVGSGELAYGLVNKGSVSAYGVQDGVNATAVRIGRAAGAGVEVAGGVNNLNGGISAQSYGGTADAILLERDAVVPALLNSGSITAEQIGGAQNARAIADQSGRLVYVESSGTIVAKVTASDGVAQTGEAIAIDLSRNTTGAVVRQTAGSEAAPSSITGIVQFGSGDDRLSLESGSLTGDIRFGAGADTFVIDGGAEAQGAISDSDGRLAIQLANGRLRLTNTSPLTISSLDVGAAGILSVGIDPAAGATGRLQVAGDAAFADGAQVEVTLGSLLRTAATYEIVRAGSLTAGAAGATLAGAPYLYSATLRADQAAGVLSVDLRPKTAQELGLTGSGAAAYGAVFDALDRSSAIESAFLAQTTEAGFTGLYDQMLPDHSGASLMSASAMTAAVASAAAAPSFSRQRADSAVWAQEIGFNIRRDRQAAAGYDSSGFGLAGGAEAISGDQALGVSAGFITTDFHDRGADPREQVSMTLLTGGAYWRIRSGGFLAQLGAGLGYAVFDGERHLSGAGLDLTADGRWNGWLAKADASAGYRFEAGALYAQPKVALNYVRLSEGGYQEKGGGDGFDLKVDKRVGDFLTGEAGLAIGARFGDAEAFWAPEVSVGYRRRLAGAAGRTTARFGDGDSFTVDAEAPFEHAVTGRAGVKMGFGGVLIAIDGGGAFEADYREYDVRALIRYQF